MERDTLFSGSKFEAASVSAKETASAAQGQLRAYEEEYKTFYESELARTEAKLRT